MKNGLEQGPLKTGPLAPGKDEERRRRLRLQNGLREEERTGALRVQSLRV